MTNWKRFDAGSDSSMIAGQEKAAALAAASVFRSSSLRNMAGVAAMSVMLAGCSSFSSFSFADLNPFSDDVPEETYSDDAANAEFPDVKEIPELPTDNPQRIEEIREGLTSARDLAKYSQQNLQASKIDIEEPGAPGATGPAIAAGKTNIGGAQPVIEESPVVASGPAPTPAPVVAAAPVQPVQLPETQIQPAPRFNALPAFNAGQPGQMQTVVISSGGVNGISAARSMYQNALASAPTGFGGGRPLTQQGQQYAPAAYNAQHTADLAPVVISSAGVQSMAVAPQALANNRPALAGGANPNRPGYFQPVAYQPGASIAIGVERGEPLGRIRFGNGKARVGNQELAMLRDIVKRQKASGGVLKVVGHASQRTREMSLDDHILANFNISQKRAEAVADKLVRLGVAPQNIIVEARGANEPVYFEIMPSGEAENRRVEIFLQ